MEPIPKISGTGKVFEAKLKGDGRVVYVERSGSPSAVVGLELNLLESESHVNAHSEATVNSSEPVSGWEFQIICEKLGDPPRVRFPDEGKWFKALNLCDSSHSLLWICNHLIGVRQRVLWHDPDLYELSVTYFQELAFAYWILWEKVSSTFIRLYCQGWKRLGAVSNHEPLILPGYDEYDRCVWQLIINIGRRIVFDDGVHALLVVYFDRRQFVKLTLSRFLNGRRCERDVEHVKSVGLSPGFELPDDCYGTPEPALTEELLPPPYKQEKQAWVFPALEFQRIDVLYGEEPRGYKSN